MFHPEFPQAQVIILCTRTNTCNYCDQNYMSGDTLYAGEMFEQQEDLGLPGSLIKNLLSL